MKIIVNRGFDKLFARIVIGKDAQKTISCPTQQDYYDLDTKKGEQIVVKLRYPSTFTYTIASIDTDDDNQVYYICPTGLFKKWTALNYMLLPGICLLLFILKIAVPGLCDHIFAGSMALWALSLICMGFCQHFPLTRKNIFKTIRI